MFKNSRIKYMKSQVVESFREHQNDVGSSSVQIAQLTFKINRLSAHMEKNKKDYSSLRGLTKMSSQRRRFMKYLKENNDIKYESMKYYIKNTKYKSEKNK